MLIRIITRINNYINYRRSIHYRKRLHVQNLELFFPIFINNLDNLIIGERCVINAFVHIWANEKVYIGENTMIASHVQISTSTHDYNIHPMRSFRRDASVRIGKNVWIGSGAIILPGIEIGDNSVIGAGSIVTKSIPANVVAYGTPARIVKQINIQTSP